MLLVSRCKEGFKRGQAVSAFLKNRWKKSFQTPTFGRSQIGRQLERAKIGQGLTDLCKSLFNLVQLW